VVVNSTEPNSPRATRRTVEGAGDPAGSVAAGLAEALALVGDRWSLAIVANLLDGPLRFGALQEFMPEISPNVLSQRLRALQAGGLLLATPYSRRPARYLYELTSAGAELAAPLRLLGDWGSRQLGAHVDPPRHDACEAPLELRWYCPACEEPVAAAAAEAAEDLYFA
jgi:DNA-binding HxlR family transcriptional regulator